MVENRVHGLNGFRSVPTVPLSAHYWKRMADSPPDEPISPLRPNLLRPCPACGREVARSARSCPNCGHPLKPRRTFVWVAALGIGILLVVGLGLTIRNSGGLPIGFQAPLSPLTTAQVVSLVQPSVVTVNVTVFRGGTSEGSGFIYGKLGLVLTNAHVVARALSITVTTADGRTIDVAELDVAGLEVDNHAKPLRVAKEGASVGEDVLVIGNPFGVLPNTLTNGLVGGTGRDLTIGNTTYHNLVQTNAVVNPGNSGSPMVDTSGALIGIVTLGGSGYAFAIPVTNFDAETTSWAKTPTAITLGPPLVTANAQTLVIAGGLVPVGMQVIKSEAWGTTGYHISYQLPPTYVAGGQALNSYVDVTSDPGQATTGYNSYVSQAKQHGLSVVATSAAIGDQVTTLQLVSSQSAEFEVVLRDRNVAAILDWSSALPNYVVSLDGTLALAEQEEPLIGANLAAYQ